MKLIALAFSFCVFTSVFGDYSIMVENNIPIKRSWVEAINECANHGLILATPDTNAKNDALKNFITAHSLAYAHISANDLLVEGKYEWMTTGKPVTNTGMWHTGHPINTNNQDCVYMGHSGLIVAWYDYLCDIQAAVVCEPAVPELVASVQSRLPIIRNLYERKYGI